MYYSKTFTCDQCGDSRDLASDFETAGTCRSCGQGTYCKSGETYDQEWIEQQLYERQQDQEYEESHRRE